MPHHTGVKRVFLLEYAWLAGDMGWFVPTPSTAEERGKPKPREWADVPAAGILVEHDDGLVLVDLGVHPEAREVWPKELFAVFPVTKFTDENRLENQLKAIGYKPEDVDYVVFTHLHLDHTGHAYLFRDSKAAIVLHKKELTHALYSIWIGRPGAYVPSDIEQLRGANLHPFEGAHLELLPGIDLIWVGGHTPGSTMVKVETKAGNTYIFTGDIVHLPIELEVEAKGWLLGDYEEYITALKKLKLLLKRPRTYAIIPHDPELFKKYPKAPKPLE